MMTTTTRTGLSHTARTIGHVYHNSESKWTAAGWTSHLERKTNAYEAINSYLKHEKELGDEGTRAGCLVLTFARCKDLGVPAAEAARFLTERREKALAKESLEPMTEG